MVVFLTFAAWLISRPVLARSANETSSEQALNSLAAMQPIDVHVHIFKSDLAFQKFFDATHLTLMNILVMDDTLPYRKKLQPQITDALNLKRQRGRTNSSRTAFVHGRFCTDHAWPLLRVTVEGATQFQSPVVLGARRIAVSVRYG